MPQDASLNAGGFRFYKWEPSDKPEHQDALRRFNALAAVDVLSVTSIRRLCGEQYNLVSWQIANVIDVAMGTVARTKIGPKGGVSKVRVKDQYPSEFVEKYLAGQGTQEALDDLRKWTRAQADEPRNIAAARGTIVHETIEKSVSASRVEREYVEAMFAGLSAKDKRRVGSEVKDEDVLFVARSMRQYEDMRAHVPYVILAREPQVWNLTAGYAGSADVLIWFLPEAYEGKAIAITDFQKRADKGELTLEMIQSVGGRICLGDYKTSEGVYTDQVVQVTAYLAVEFIGKGGVIDERLTAMVRAADQGALIHIRPDKWAVHFIDWEEGVLRAFFGSCAFARFLAMYPTPTPLFKNDLTGAAPDE